MSVVDAHQHFWRVDRGDYGWLDNAPTALVRDWLPDDLRPLLKGAGVSRTVLVQAAPTVAETRFLLELARDTDFVAGVVGWLDLEAVDFAVQLDAMRAVPKFVGIRPMLHDLPDDRWIVRPAVHASLATIAAAGVAFDVVCQPRHLPYVADALARTPSLRAVIDHMAKPAIASGEIEQWSDALAAIAAYPETHCKLSGLLTEASVPWSVEELMPYVAHALELFGPARLMWGSDWPVALLASDYETTLESARTVLAPLLSADDLAQVMGETAARFYKLLPAQDLAEYSSSAVASGSSL